MIKAMQYLAKMWAMLKFGYDSYINWRPFSEPDAWTLFKIAAIAEAIGWTMLIGGIFMRDVLLNGNGIPVTIAGRIHGTWFAVYIFAVLMLSPSLRWPLWRILIAGLCSVPPYGSLVYEQISSVLRNQSKAQQFHSLVRYRLVTQQVVL